MFQFQKEGLNIGSNIPTSSQIPIDYFIKATYISKAGENIRLISDIYNLNKIQKMTIDGKTAAPTKNYDFFRNTENNHRIPPSKVKTFSNNLENENKKLKEENEKLKEKINDCIKKLEESYEKLKEKENIIANNIKKIKDLEKSIQDKENSLNKYLQENNKLINDIEKLKKSIPFNLSEGEKLISIAFLSSDQNICFPVICKNTDNFIKIENLIYEKYPEYKDPKNDFFINGNKFNKNGSLEENNIKDKSIIILQANDNE
jgi:hypothetical protein